MISIEQIRRFPLFGGLEFHALKAIAMAGQDSTVDAGTWLFVEGEEAEAFYLILNGTIDLKMSMNAKQIEQADLERLTEYEGFGWSALVNPYVYTLSAYVAEDTRLLAINAEKLRSLMDQHVDVGYMLTTRMAEIIRERLTNMHTRFVSLIPVA
jgi:CRP-like cAMP-binding protein